MNVYVAYAKLEPETAAAAGPGATYVDTGGDDEAYWRLLRDLWARKRSFILLEQDIVPPPGALEALEACPHEWCGVPYPVGNIWGVFHGCTKYGASIIKRYPEALRSFSSRYWQNLDSQLIAYIGRRQKEGPHFHWPAAEHLRFIGDTVYANCGDCGGPLRWADLKDGPERNVCPRCGRIPSYFHHFNPPVAPLRRRNDLATALKYIGNGGYLNGVPAADFETDDAQLLAECVESGLYEVASAKGRKDKAAAEPAPQPAPAAESVAPSAEAQSTPAE